MKVVPTGIPDVFILEPKVFADERGYFYESYNERAFRQSTGLDVRFVQDNHSRSLNGVLRGLHYQLPPAAQGKLVHCTAGEVFDVAVDIRKNSPTFGKWVGMSLSVENKRMMWIPPGFAHGFLALSGAAEFVYKTTAYYAPEHERCICWNDPDLAIDWPLLDPQLSPRDRFGIPFSKAELFD